MLIPVEFNPIWSNNKYPVFKSRLTLTVDKVPIPTFKLGLTFNEISSLTARVCEVLKVTFVLNFLIFAVNWLNSLWNKYSSLLLLPDIDLKNKSLNDAPSPVFNPIKSFPESTIYKLVVGKLNTADVGVVDTEIWALPAGIVKLIFWLL